MSKGIVAIGCDHAGFPMKATVIRFLTDKGLQIIDHGTFSAESVDYPDFAHPVAINVEQGVADWGVLICGSGNGVAMTANKHSGIRCALCWLPELGALAHQHNNANIIALPSRFIENDTAYQILESYYTSAFEGGRHERRVEKIDC
ncbi:MAG: ribose 5-phosphate isomerase B [Saprospiraceae bacterium]|jgi:ribose 5-phosphate isomerase B|nr:ribose 5-phosphate isomerase B [Saprospiraceae bacterium]MCA0333429.1 ribose 5-phosphate isomerase B [Bacteroidota bacterium]MCB0604465.1 ribose 5-phosphate isomerase B [Saprospiraceae bacterium]MCO5277571.1 ribose 5-phosphate isomerase B [Saprospiraceae bacterium]HMT76669.1 ribose 5-phosphate isomerase B [Saprospiraceae bacterium]